MKYAPQKLTTAQRMLVVMGLDSDLLIGHHHDLERHPTKRGPGRKHAEGKDASRVVRAKGRAAGPGFVLHKASANKRLRRACVKLTGIRQHKREQRAARTSELVAELVG